MSKTQRRGIISFTVVVIMIIFSVSCRWINYTLPSHSTTFDLHNALSLARPLIYVALIIWWSVSIQQRIVHRQTKRFMLAMSSFMIFWLIVRTIKYEIATDTEILRYLWYSYYIPSLFIPTMAMLIAVCWGKADDYSFTKATMISVIIPILLILMVFSNDLHQFVFVFDYPKPWSDTSYTYGPGYFMCIAWAVSMVICTIAILIKKCRIPRSRKFLYTPFIPIALLVVYLALYPFLTKLPNLNVILGDFTVCENLFCIAILECCIQCGLIQSNTGYEELFYMSASAIGITDESFEMKYSSSSAPHVSADIMKKAATAPIELKENKRLCSGKIKNGYVFWMEDVSEINRLLKKLRSVKEHLEGANDLLQAENELKENQVRVDTLSRLYSSIAKDVEPQLKALDKMLKNISPDDEDFNDKMARVCVLGAYIKRRGNMILLSEDSPYITSSELAYCIGESVDNLEAMGISCSFLPRAEGKILKKYALGIYDLFENVVEVYSMETKYLVVKLNCQESFVELRMMLENTDVSHIENSTQAQNIEDMGGSVNIKAQSNDLIICITLPRDGDEDA